MFSISRLSFGLLFVKRKFITRLFIFPLIFLGLIISFSACSDSTSSVPTPPEDIGPNATVQKIEMGLFDKAEITLNNASGATDFSIFLETDSGFKFETENEILPSGKIGFRLPFGVPTDETMFAEGQFKVELNFILEGDTTLIDAGVVMVEGLEDQPQEWERGVASITWLEVQKLLAIRSISNMGIIEVNSSTIDINSAVTQTNKFIDGISNNQEFISRVSNGEVFSSENTGASLTGTINTGSLRDIDKYSYAMLKHFTDIEELLNKTPKSFTAGAFVSNSVNYKDYQFPGGTSSFSLPDDFENFANDLANSFSEIATEESENILGTVGTVATIGAAVAVAAGASAFATGAAIVGATAFLVGTAISWNGALINVGTEAIIEGQASETTVIENLQNVGQTYSDGIVEYFTGVPGTGELFEALVAQVYDIGEGILQDGQFLLDELSLLFDQVNDAISDGDFPPEGIPESAFSISSNYSINAGTGSYIVLATTSSAGNGESLQLKVSGTDGFIANETAVVVGGQASWALPIGASGVTDSINIYHIGGRAQSSGQITF